MLLQTNTTNRFPVNGIYQMDAFWFRNPSCSIEITYPSKVSYSEFEIDRFITKISIECGTANFTLALHKTISLTDE